MASAGKVLIIVQNLPVPFDRRVWLEALALKEREYQVSVICPTGQHGKYQERKQIINDIAIYRYPAPPEANNVFGYLFEFIYCWIWTAFLSLKVHFSCGFNIIHACNPPETYFLLAFGYKLFGTRFIFDHHDLSPEMYIAKGGSKDGILFKGLIFLEKMTFRMADVVITTNESHKKIAMDRGGVLEEDIFIVRSGPDFERLKRLEPELSLKNGYPYLVCYLGEMCPQDGVDYLLDVAEILRTDHGRTDIKFTLMGGGPSLEELKKDSSDRGFDKQVEFTGRVSDHDLCRYLSTADVCLDPDPYNEWSNQSTMNKIMEYMAFGKPIVAFELKENRFSAGEAAVYARSDNVHEFASLIVELLNDDKRRQLMGRTGQERVDSKLAWRYSKDYLYNAYNRVMEK